MNQLTEGIQYLWIISVTDLEETLKTSDIQELQKILGFRGQEGDIEELQPIESIGLNPTLYRLHSEIEEEERYLIFEETQANWPNRSRFAYQNAATSFTPNALHKKLEQIGIKIHLVDGSIFEDDLESSVEDILFESKEAAFQVKDLEPLLEESGIEKPDEATWGEALFHDPDLVQEFSDWTEKKYGVRILPNVISYMEGDEDIPEEISCTPMAFYTTSLTTTVEFGEIARRAFELGLTPRRIASLQRFGN